MNEITIHRLQEQMGAGEVTARAASEYYLARIARLDRAGPLLNSVIELNPDALAIADALDAERRERGPRGPLHGTPILLKDNIDTADRMSTTAGSLALVGSRPARDATVALKLRQAGAVILGKTNLSEWANFRSSRSTSGWSSRGGQTRNPYALDRNPCGSSSGSAVAVAADLCAAAIGTETDGSIICPAQTNGIVGIKPTLGLVSRAGIIPIAHSQDTAGAMARTVADAAVLLSVLAGTDPLDPATSASEERSSGDYTAYLHPDGLRGARIGVARSLAGADSRIADILDECIRAMRDLGAVIVDPAIIETPKELEDGELEVLLYEFKADLNAYLASCEGARVHTLVDVIEFNERHRETVTPFFGQELMLKAQEKGPLTNEAYLQALETNLRLSRTEGIDATLEQHALDAIVAPSGGPAWLTDYVLGDHFTGSGSSLLAAVAGYPSITVPAGFVCGLPVGISFFTGAYAEPTLIRLAYAFEQATRVRRPPEFPATVDTRQPARP
jgi:amidase